MNIAVGLVQHRPGIHVTLESAFRTASGDVYPAGNYRLTAPVALQPIQPETGVFALEAVTIGVGFHWERQRRQRFRGALRVIEDSAGLTAVNDVPLEDYVESVIASEMSGDSPLELLKAHAIISRSWLGAQLARQDDDGSFHRQRQTGPDEWELFGWYGREAHTAFDVCADDHCQRYQGLGTRSENAVRAVRSTAGQFLTFQGAICDTRFSKSCGGVTEHYRTAWEDREVPYLQARYDGDGPLPLVDEAWIRTRPDAYCSTVDPALTARILPGFDQETADFYRWSLEYGSVELAEIVRDRTGIDLEEILALEPLERGPSGRIRHLKIRGRAGVLTVGKELEIRRVLSHSHLYSSAFVADVGRGRVRLSGAGWGHGVGLCQIGAAVMAVRGASSADILSHYYAGTLLEKR